MNSQAFTIRPALAGELPAVEDLLRGAKLPVEGVRDMGDLLLVALDGDRLVGSAGLELHGTAGLLRSVATVGTDRGRGIGQALVERVMGAARQRGVRRVFLLTETAAGFFPRLGFRPVERGDVDPSVQRSAEFSLLCPASAVAMVRELPTETSS